MSENGAIYWTNERRRLGELVPWPINPRQIKKAEAERLNQSLDEFSQVETIAIGPENQVYNGHQRLNVWMQEHGPDFEVDVRVASRHLGEDERKKLTVFLHKGAAGEWDFDVLANNFEVDDLLDWGFDEKELDLDMWASDEPPEDPGAQIDRAEELREKWGVESGQLWKLGEHRLICGDCTNAEVVERLEVEPIASVIADPPYGINLDTDYSKIKGTDKSPNALGYEYKPVEGDDKPFDFIPFAEWNYKEQFWFGADYYARQLPHNGSWFVWIKRNEADAEMIGNDFELCWSKQKHKRRALRIRWVGWDATEHNEQRIHPTQKPIELMEWFMDKYLGDIVLDPFLGSGTTLIACERLNRKCRAVEISPAYCAVAIQRWHDMTGEMPELITE